MSSTEDVDDHGCQKCGHTETEVDEMSTTRSTIPSILDRTLEFIVISCANCGYTEVYRRRSSVNKRRSSDEIVDLFLG